MPPSSAPARLPDRDPLDSFASRHALTPAARAELHALVDLTSPETTLPSWSEGQGSEALRTLILDDVSEGPAAPTAAGLGRFERLGLLGEGATGTVWRVHDPVLGRTVALKVLRPELGHRAEALARIIQEARTTARLQHAGVVPVYELGRLEDGRVWFTMREVRGRTLRAVIRDRWASDGTAARRGLVELLRRAVEAVAYAHSHGVVHRDLKPSNIMVGEFGEVLVVDWGLAHLLDDAPHEGLASAVGTPGYMPPEQATGRYDEIGPPADVWSLGAILLEILTGRAPYAGLEAEAILMRVRAGTPPSLDGVEPAPLAEVCDRALRPAPEHRYGDASALAAELDAWLVGTRAREQALAAVADSDRVGAEILGLQTRADDLRARAEQALAGVQAWEPEARKAEGWGLLQDAEALDQQIRRLEQQRLEGLRSALSLVPALPEARERLADHYLAVHKDAEARRDAARAAEAELLLRRYGAGRHAAWLEGRGALSLTSDPPGAEVDLYRYTLHNRRLVPTFERSLGVTPLDRAPLERGSWLLVLRAPGRAEVRFPVRLGRQEHQAVDLPVPLPPPLDPGEVYVPPGRFLAGSDPEADKALPGRRLWVDGFILQRHPVTNRDYLTFLNDLLDQGREADALRFAPRERPGVHGAEGALIYGRDAAGRFIQVPDADGDTWDPDWPVFQVDWTCAVAYAAWLTARTGQPWRLPSEWEWEKAARGVDGRAYPWGDQLDPSWCCMWDSHAARPLPARVTAFPVDESPYGARGLAGNVRDWCMEAWDPEADGLGEALRRADIEARWAEALEAATQPPPRVTPPELWRALRGGSWNGDAQFARTAQRSWTSPSLRGPYQGFRLARSWSP
ncbi:MAG: SUMF1/EgtB/PvdO family nonheme iron enzyme [Alphaproteobacteria bacterium]|nr:SUMF1/EgtB/PvdO family nonheme iron enzyme [Alphaproteobacteria bacterium]